MSTNSTACGFPVRESGQHSRWLGWLSRQPSSSWTCLALILLALGLLWTFHQVTLGIVQRSELRLQIINEYNAATWRCNSLSSRVARQSCLLQRKELASEIATRLPS
jgi:hypothetical protein